MTCFRTLNQISRDPFECRLNSEFWLFAHLHLFLFYFLFRLAQGAKIPQDFRHSNRIYFFGMTERALIIRKLSITRIFSMDFKSFYPSMSLYIKVRNRKLVIWIIFYSSFPLLIFNNIYTKYVSFEKFSFSLFLWTKLPVIRILN